MGKNTRLIYLVSIALLVIIASAVIMNMNETGTVAGKVTIGPFSPVEPSLGSVVPPGTYSSRSVILTPIFGKPTYIPLNEDGSFEAEIYAGAYRATVSNCIFLGCKSSLPVTVTVIAGEIVVLNIDIDTGIR
jgi:hypothetical protein